MEKKTTISLGSLIFFALLGWISLSIFSFYSCFDYAGRPDWCGVAGIVIFGAPLLLIATLLFYFLKWLVFKLTGRK